MARLVTSGFETGHALGEGQGIVVTGAAASTAAPRTGAYHLRAASGQFVYWPFSGGATDRDYFFRFYFNKSANPLSADAPCTITTSGGTAIAYIELNTNGSLTVRDSGTTALFSTGVLNNGQWYEIQFRVRVGTSTTGQVELLLDGTQVGVTSSANCGTTAPGRAGVGLFYGALGAAQLDFDDVALNDGTGAAQNSWPGPGKVTLLLPASDSAVGSGWQKPGGSTANLNTAVDNRPPVGIADSTSAANAEKQIRNATNTNTANYAAVTGTFTAAGISVGGISVLQAIAQVGSSSATATNGAIACTANPSDAGETAFVYATAIAGTYPSNWTSVRGAPVYAPSPTAGTGVTVRVGKRTSTTRVALVSQVGVYVDWGPATQHGVAPLTGTGTLSAAARRIRRTGAALAGLGSISATARSTRRTGAALSGSGTLSAFGARFARAAATLTGSGTLSGAGRRLYFAAASLSGAGALTASARRTRRTGAGLAGIGTLNGAGERIVHGAASLSGTGSESATGRRTRRVGSALSGTGALSAQGSMLFHGAATLSAEGALTADGIRTARSGSSLSGAGTLSAIGKKLVVAAAALDGGGSLSAWGTHTVRSSASLAGIGTLNAAGERLITAAAALDGLGSLSASGSRTARGAASLDGTGSLSATITTLVHAAAALTGTGSLSASGQRTARAAANFAGAGSLVAYATTVIHGAAVLTGQATLAATGRRTARTGASLAGTGALNSIGERTIRAAAQLSGSGAAAAHGTITRRAGGTLVGAGQLHAAGVRTVFAASALEGFGSLRARAGKLPVSTFTTVLLAPLQTMVDMQTTTASAGVAAETAILGVHVGSTTLTIDVTEA